MDENSLTNIVGISAGIFTAVSLLPQIVKIIKEKQARDISLFYLAVLFLGLVLWTYYGVLKKHAPIIATNAVSLVLNITMIILGLIYKHKDVKS